VGCVDDLEFGIFQYEKLDTIMKENDEILAIVVASLITTKLRKRNS
jgi:hypothetical protein